jgi:hypothetical protein
MRNVETTYEEIPVDERISEETKSCDTSTMVIVFTSNNDDRVFPTPYVGSICDIGSILLNPDIVKVIARSNLITYGVSFYIDGESTPVMHTDTINLEKNYLDKFIERIEESKPVALKDMDAIEYAAFVNAFKIIKGLSIRNIASSCESVSKYVYMDGSLNVTMLDNLIRDIYRFMELYKNATLLTL